jgi:O-antigen/teichoic acid export membrane protein
MNRIRKIGANIFSLFTGEALASVLGLLTTILLARRLGDEHYGYVVLAQTIALYMMIAQDLGLSIFGSREIAKFPSRLKFVLANVITLRMLLTLFVLAIFFSVIWSIHLKGMELYLYVGISLWLLPNIFHIDFVFQGREKMLGISLFRFLHHFSYLLMVFLFVKSAGEYWESPYYRMISYVIGIASIWYIYKLPGNLIRYIKSAVWFGFLRTSIVMALSVVLIKVYYSFDTLMLAFWYQANVIGWYNAAYKVIFLFIGVGSLIQTAFSPSFAREVNTPQFGITMKYYAIVLVGVASLCFGTTILLNKELILFIYGEAFRKASRILILLAVSGFVLYLSTIFSGPLLYGNKHKEYTVVVSVAVVTNIFLNLILIPEYSFIGAAVATIFGNCVLLLTSFYFFSKNWPLEGLIVSILNNSLIFVGCISVTLLVAVPSLIQLGLFILFFLSTFSIYNRFEIKHAVRVWLSR